MSTRADDIGRKLGVEIMAALATYQNNAPRTLQSTMRVLGMSELGGCREYIRASVAGDPKTDGKRLKWAAFVGTAVGDLAEAALVATIPGATSQETVTVTLPDSGISVSGHTDAILDGAHDALIDFKTKDGLAEVKRDGASFKELVQVSGYLTAAIQEGRLSPTATAHLVYIDRSGSDPTAYVVSVDAAEARAYLQAADERLIDVANALRTGTRAPRDQPESWCYWVECPFYTACWEGYMATGEITDEDQRKAAKDYVELRNEKKRIDTLARNARDKLIGVTGITADGINVNWKLTERSDGGMSETIDVRQPRTPAGKK